MIYPLCVLYLIIWIIICNIFLKIILFIFEIIKYLEYGE